MTDWMKLRAEKLRDFLNLKPDVEMIPPSVAETEARSATDCQLLHCNIEWHLIPSSDAVPMDNRYFQLFYPRAARDFDRPHEPYPSRHAALIAGHRQHQGHIIGVETTPKPGYLPGNRQYYGTRYGFDPTADPYAPYFGRAGMVNGTRYAHNYISLRAFLRVINDDWRARSVMPRGYRVTICPPAIFNLVGTVFHPEWSETEPLELGFYRDAQGNATCFAVGSSGPGDYSYINIVEGEEWTLMGFRLALVPE